MNSTSDTASINIAAAKGRARVDNARNLALLMLAVVNILVVITAIHAGPGNTIGMYTTPAFTAELVVAIVFGTRYVRRH